MIAHAIPKRLAIGLAVAVIAVAGGAGALGASGSGTITTIAGTGKYGYSGDGGPAKAAMLSQPNYVAVDRKRNVYIADWGYCRVRKVSPSGKISTVAGLGTATTSACVVGGDGGPATSARIEPPAGVAVDGQGNVYISGRGRVRMVSSTGTMSTLAGADTGRNGALGDGGPATSARLLGPWGLATDRQGNVYIAESGDYRVRKVSRDGTITTFAGTGKSSGPVGDGGPATSARLINPTALAVDTKGNLYITESGSGNDRVRKVSPGGRITTVAGGGGPGATSPARSLRLDHPYGVAVDGRGSIYVTTGSRVYKVSAAGKVTTTAGTGVNGFSGDGGPAIRAKVAAPRGLAVDGQGNLYITDTLNNRVRKVRP